MPPWRPPGFGHIRLASTRYPVPSGVTKLMPLGSRVSNKKGLPEKMAVPNRFLSFQEPGSVLRFTLRTRYSLLGTWSSVHRTWCPVLGTWYLVPGTLVLLYFGTFVPLYLCTLAPRYPVSPFSSVFCPLSSDFCLPSPGRVSCLLSPTGSCGRPRSDVGLFP
jgi:hypothetical protein